MTYKMTEERWAATKAYLNNVWRNPAKYPDKGLILSLSDTELTQLFTRKRMELVRLIQNRKPANATKLSKLAGRQLSAVMRDLELLEKFGIVVLEKQGKNIVPMARAEILVLPLIDLKAKSLKEIEAIA